MTKGKRDGYNKPIASRLRAIIDRDRLKQSDIAEKVGVTRQSISYYADGSSVPDAETLGKIADALNVSADYLLGLSDLPSRGIVTSGDAARCLVDLIEKLHGITDIEPEHLEGGGPGDFLPKTLIPERIHFIFDNRFLIDFFQKYENTKAIFKDASDAKSEELKRMLIDKLISDGDSDMID